MSAEIHNADELGQYRAMSGLAVVALLFGLAAPLHFAFSAFAAIPVAGIILALVALWKIQSSGGALAGSLLAKLGMAISVVFLTAPLAHSFFRDAASRSAVEQQALRWLAAISQENWGEAAVLTDKERLFALLPRSNAPDAPPPVFDVDLAIARMAEDDAVRAIVSWNQGEKSRFELLEAAFSWSTRSPEAACFFELKPVDEEARRCTLALVRRTDAESRFIWLVKNWSVDSESE